MGKKKPSENFQPCTTLHSSCEHLLLRMIWCKKGKEHFPCRSLQFTNDSNEPDLGTGKTMTCTAILAFPPAPFIFCSNADPLSYLVWGEISSDQSCPMLSSAQSSCCACQTRGLFYRESSRVGSKKLCHQFLRLPVASLPHVLAFFISLLKAPLKLCCQMTDWVHHADVISYLAPVLSWQFMLHNMIFSPLHLEKEDQCCRES